MRVCLYLEHQRKHVLNPKNAKKGRRPLTLCAVHRDLHCSSNTALNTESYSCPEPYSREISAPCNTCRAQAIKGRFLTRPLNSKGRISPLLPACWLQMPSRISCPSSSSSSGLAMTMAWDCVSGTSPSVHPPGMLSGDDSRA